MLKHFLETLKTIRLMCKRQTMQLSQKWREDELVRYEHETDLKAGIY